MSAPGSVAPPALKLPAPRSFALPLPVEADQSHLSRMTARASVSATANPLRSALRTSGRVMTSSAPMGGGSHKHRRPRTQHELELMGAAASADAEAQLNASAVATAAHPHAHARSFSGDHPLHGSNATGAASGMAPTASVAELLLAASGGSSSASGQRGGIGRGDGRGRVSFSTAAEDDAAMLEALSTAMHAEDSYASPHANGRSRRHSNRSAGSAAAIASASASLPVPTAHIGRVPALPPALLQSLVRSHGRHVGLSARLKTRAHVRELREAQSDRGGAGGLGAGAPAGDSELARQQKLEQAARAAFPAAHAANGASRSRSRSRSRSPRRRRNHSSSTTAAAAAAAAQQEEEEKQNHSYLSAPSLRSPRLRSHQGRGGGGLGARGGRASRGATAEVLRELGLSVQMQRITDGTTATANTGSSVPSAAMPPSSQPQPQQQPQQQAAQAFHPSRSPAASSPRVSFEHDPAGVAIAPGSGAELDPDAASGVWRDQHGNVIGAEAAGPSSPPPAMAIAGVRSPPPPSRSHAQRSRLLLGSFAPALG